MTPMNPYIELLIASVIIVFWFPVLTVVAFKLLGWLLGLTESRNNVRRR